MKIYIRTLAGMIVESNSGIQAELGKVGGITVEQGFLARFQTLAVGVGVRFPRRKEGRERLGFGGRERRGRDVGKCHEGEGAGCWDGMGWNGFGLFGVEDMYSVLV